MRVVQQLHDLHFSVNLLQVGGVQPGLIYNLYCHLKEGIKRNEMLCMQKKNQ